jgi:hypothetical protein
MSPLMPLWAGSSVCNGPHSEHDTGSAKRDRLQRADQIGPIVNTDDSDGAHLSVAETSA